MKKHRDVQQEMRDRRRKQVLRRIQEQEWENDQRQYWSANEESGSPDQMDVEEDRDKAR